MSATAIVVLAAVLLVWTEIEAWGRQREMERLLVAEGGVLVEALVHAVEHGLVMGREVEELASARLLDVALLLDRLERALRLFETQAEGEARRIKRMAGRESRMSPNPPGWRIRIATIL